MPRALLVAVLSLLLLGMQHEMLVHAFQHDGARIAAGNKASAQTASDARCLECALTAGGSYAPAALLPSLDVHRAAFIAPTARAATRDSPAPVYYSSRAPPVPA